MKVAIFSESLSTLRTETGPEHGVSDKGELWKAPSVPAWWGDLHAESSEWGRGAEEPEDEGEDGQTDRWDHDLKRSH